MCKYIYVMIHDSSFPRLIVVITEKPCQELEN